jgi:lysophospholipase
LAAPLISIRGAPVPDGGEAEWFTGVDGARLRAALFPAKGEVRGSIVLSGGRTEAIEKYFETIEDLTGRGYVVLTHDWRGQGLSHRELKDRLAGHASGYQAFLGDYHALLAAYESRLPKPWFAIGHSMGGCLTLLALAHGEASRFEGAILSAPMLGLQTGGVPLLIARAMAGFNVMLGRAGRFARSAGAPETFENNVLTHDRARYERGKAQILAAPDLGLGGPTWGWLDFAFRATAYLAQGGNLKSVTIPVVIVSAEQDKLVDNDAQRAVAKNLPQGEFINVPGAYHEILMETDTMRNIFLRALDTLLGKSTAPATAATPAAPEPAPVAAKPVAAAPIPETALVPTPEPAPVPLAAVAPAPAAKAPAKKAAAPKTAAAPKASAKPAAPKAVAKPAAVKKAEPAPAKPAAKKAAAPPVKAAAPKKAPVAKAAPAPAPKATAKVAAPKAPAKKAAAPKAAAPKAAPKAAAKPATVKVPAAPKAPAAKPAAKKAPAAKA